MKIIHCSDIHLDSALGQNFSAAQAKARNAELCATFSRMVRFAVQERVSAVLIAGDLFDGSYGTSQTAEFILQQIRSAPDVTFFYLPGNHDGGSNLLDSDALPDNLKIFADHWTSYRCADALITGINPTEEQLNGFYEQLDLPKNTINIVVLHGQISTQPGPELIALPKLRNKNIDYLALGHIHSYQKGKLDERGEFSYCGCLEGRGFDECGEKGVYYIELSGDSCRAEFIPTCTRKYEVLELDAAQDILPQLPTSTENDIYRLILCGECERAPEIKLLETQLGSRFFALQIKDKTRPVQDIWECVGQDSLRGLFLQRMKAALDKAENDTEREKIIQAVRWTLAALDGGEAVEEI